MVAGMLSHFGIQKAKSEPEIASYPTDPDIGNISPHGREFHRPRPYPRRPHEKCFMLGWEMLHHLHGNTPQLLSNHAPGRG